MTNNNPAFNRSSRPDPKNTRRRAEQAITTCTDMDALRAFMSHQNRHVRDKAVHKFLTLQPRCGFFGFPRSRKAPEPSMPKPAKPKRVQSVLAAAVDAVKAPRKPRAKKTAA